MVSILTDIGDEQLPATQALIDDVYAQVLAQIELAKAKRATKWDPKPKPAARGKGRYTDMPEHKISPKRIRTSWRDISVKEYHGWR